jgi:hypothetical protein
VVFSGYTHLDLSWAEESSQRHGSPGTERGIPQVEVQERRGGDDRIGRTIHAND